MAIAELVDLVDGAENLDLAVIVAYPGSVAIAELVDSVAGQASPDTVVSVDSVAGQVYLASAATRVFPALAAIVE